MKEFTVNRRRAKSNTAFVPVSQMSFRQKANRMNRTIGPNPETIPMVDQN